MLVTGAGGFIGSHLVERLVAEGVKVHAFVRYTARTEIGDLPLAPPARIEFIFGDLRDGHAVAEAMRGAEVVFRLGALIAIPYSYLRPREVVETNVIGTLNVLIAAKELRTPRVIHTSTREVYGTPPRVLIDEAHPLQGQSPYSASKIGADKLVESFIRSFDMPAITLRSFNTYGPRPSARAVIPTIISQAPTRDEIQLGDLTPRRDFTYVAVTVDGFVRTAAAEGVIGETINLGNDDESSIGDLAQLIIQSVGRPVAVRPSASEVRHLHVNNRKAKEKLGWSSYTPLAEGLRRTIEWVRAHPEFFDPERYTV